MILCFLIFYTQPHERIAASVIYYYDTDEAIFDAGLSFRRIRTDESDFPSVHEFSHDVRYLCHSRCLCSFDNTSSTAPQSFKIYFADDEDGERIDPDEPPEEYEEDYPSDWEQLGPDGTLEMMSTGSLSTYIHLGTVPTTNFVPVDQDGDSRGTGRMLSFPNWIQVYFSLKQI